MNLRRGLIRLWVLASVIWVAGIVTVAASDPNIHWAAEPKGKNWWEEAPVIQGAEAADPYAGIAEPEPAQVKPEAAQNDPFAKYQQPGASDAQPKAGAQAEPDGVLMSGIKRVVAVGSEPAIWKYAGIAFGVPIVLLVFGAGVWWVASGFRSETTP